ncbi:zinc transporter [Veronia nyctiphanis]|uniref:High-affinity zinc uptake system protein ZnuA n=1 Tax=Veronia nyctiphanis TaxID=1278244 RepID=A0A4Q0YRW8_9GAMM|nr:zinc ABC transporter substrate-binding protein [Veronia nyctiphanis]RXJ73937.1 zinc transporter [Veronia nyctiphanis]
MRLLRVSGLISSVLLSSSALASSPNVAVDIAPVHSLVSQVMEGVGSPALLIQPEASPHDYSLRPSEARALANADVVFWMSEGLTPWLEKSLDTLAEKAEKVEMLEVKGTTTYAFREGATFEAHDHHGDEEHHGEEAHHGKGHHDDHGDDHHSEKNHHDDHDKHAYHDEHKDGHHDKHDDDHHDKHAKHHDDHHDEHNHEGEDPHAWLDPVNAKVWVEKIRDVLSANDPQNAATYKQNADNALKRLDNLIAKIDKETDALNKLNFIVFHDAYQYFERRFDVVASGAISLGDAQDPSAARVAKIRDLVKDLSITCVFSEPQYNPGLVNSVFEGTTVKNVGVMDPLGANIEAGSEQYEQLLGNMLRSLTECQS